VRWSEFEEIPVSGLGASSGPQERARAVHHRTDKLLVEKHAVSDGQVALPVDKGAKHTQSLSSSLLTRSAVYQG
jgi:hypothetical protein